MKNRKLGNTSIERQRNFEKIVELYQNKNYSLADIAKQFDVSKQAINQFLVKRGFFPSKEKDIKYKQHKNKAQNALIEEKLNLYKREKENQRIQKLIAQKKAKKYKAELKQIHSILFPDNKIVVSDINVIPELQKIISEILYE